MRLSPVLLAASCLVAACATTTAPPAGPEALLADQLFAPPSEPVRSDDLFAMSDAMRRYLAVDIADQLRIEGAQTGLMEALRSQAQLKLEYDAARTKKAAATFDGRTGNCLSLVIMTAAFAKELHLPVSYRSAYLEESWSRSGSLLISTGHVNITVGRRILDAKTGRDLSPITIDFLPPEEISGLRSRDISEATVIAMYANNRAAEALADGRIDDAYAWAAESVRRDPTFNGAFNTLGVVYLRHGNLDQAARAFERVLAAAPKDTRALANLARPMPGRARGDAETMRRRLACGRAVSAVPLLQPRHGGDAPGRLSHRARAVRARGRARRLVPRVPLLARRRRLAPRRRGRGPTSPRARHGQQRDAQPARSLRRQAGLAAGPSPALGGERVQLPPGAVMDNTTARRERMVAEDIAARGIDDGAVLAALRAVPREQFVAARWQAQAYEDTPLPIEDGQTISQPYIVALMLASLRLQPNDRVLEIGAGSGYASALASRIVARVDAVERHPHLAELARERLARLGYDNVAVHCADGSTGWPAGAPYDAIMVAAAGPRIPDALRDQLARGGRLVMPVDDGGHGAQRLVQLTRAADGSLRKTDLGGVMFVPLVGAQGWPDAGGR